MTQDNNALAMELEAWLAELSEEANWPDRYDDGHTATEITELGRVARKTAQRRYAILSALCQPAPAAGEVGEPVAWQWRYCPVGGEAWSDWSDGRAPGFKGDGYRTEERPLYTADMLERLAATKPIDQDQVERVTSAIKSEIMSLSGSKRRVTYDAIARAAIAAMQTTTSAGEG